MKLQRSQGKDVTNGRGNGQLLKENLRGKYDEW